MRKTGKTKTQSDEPLRAHRGVGTLRSYRSTEDWVPVEFMFYYDAQGEMRSVEYIRSHDGAEIPDGQYEMLDELGERRRRWTKWNGKWQVKWRHRWSRQS
jgi:hypothetical protein